MNFHPQQPDYKNTLSLSLKPYQGFIYQIHALIAKDVKEEDYFVAVDALEKVVATGELDPNLVLEGLHLGHGYQVIEQRFYQPLEDEKFDSLVGKIISFSKGTIFFNQIELGEQLLEFKEDSKALVRVEKGIMSSKLRYKGAIEITGIAKLDPKLLEDPK